MAEATFVILGPTAADVGGHRILLGTAKQRALLAMLLYHARQPVRIGVIVEQLWDGRTVEECRANLYALVSRARASLNRVGISDALVRIQSSEAYRLDVDPNLVDFHCFRRVLGEARVAARRGDHRTSVFLLGRAIDMWQDEPLADLRGSRADHLRRHMKEALLDAQKLMAEGLLRTGEHDRALVLMDQIVPANEIDETLAQSWISALWAVGRTDEARVFLVGFRKRFRREMHVEPAVALPGATAGHGSPINIGPGGANPAAGPPAALAQLPYDISDFTGHDRLLAELDTLADADGAGIAVISGMPGVGKTSLAVHWAYRQRHRFPDGQLYLNANAYGPMPPVEPEEALTRFLRDLGVPMDQVPAGRRQLRDRLNQLLAGRRMLIVLDNVRNSDQVRPLLPLADRCITLVTSRNRLRSLAIREGVRRLEVPPLPEDKCLTLLSRVIGKSRASAEPDAVQALARLSGGLPLALRIIGEHIAERPRARISDLSDPLADDLLGRAGDDDEDASLRTVFGWSYGALAPDAARLFWSVGLHPGSNISPVAAAAIAGIDAWDAEYLLDTLARAHLINHDTAGRYRFHDLLRRYAADQAKQEATPEAIGAALRRLLDWYLLTARNAAELLAPHRPPVPDLPLADGIEPQTFRSEGEAMRWCEAERANLVAVTHWAAANGSFQRGWQIPSTICEIYGRYGRQDDVLELFKVAYHCAKRENHLIGQIGTLNNLGTAYFVLHDHNNAADSFERALELARQVRYLDAEAACLHNLASVYLKARETTKAIRIFDTVLSRCRDAGNSIGEAAVLHRLGDAKRQLKQYDEAVACYLEALAIRKRMGLHRGQGITHGELAALYQETGAWDLALQHCQLALASHEHTNDHAGRCDTLTTLGEVQLGLARYDDAAASARAAIEIGEELADAERRCRGLIVLAAALTGAGELNGARLARARAVDLLASVAELDATAMKDRLASINDG